MYRVIPESTATSADARAFIEMLNTLKRSPIPAARTLFERDGELVVARAPGRLDVMGGIADYSGSLVLEMPTHEATLVALQRTAERTLRIVSLKPSNADREPAFEMPLAALEEQGRAIDYPTARFYFQRDPRREWAAYVAGAFLVLMRECGASFNQGSRMLISSDVPEGQGVSSSAALEVAAMRAIAAAFDIRLEPARLAVLCQKVENLVVGAPCGVMDQMTSACGEADRLLALFCQPAELQGTVTIPADIAFWGVDSGVRHSVAGADYSSVRVGAFMGYRILTELAGLKVRPGDQLGRVDADDPLWHGYLANVTPSLFEWRYARRIPESITGREFLDLYGGITDRVTAIEPERAYAVRAPTAHPIHEHFRVCLFAELLRTYKLGEDTRLRLLGEFMYQSHASYSACGLGCAGTDRLVELVRQAGPAQGLYGAKITGGGSGGTVAVLGRRDADHAVRTIADQYSRETGHAPYVLVFQSLTSAARKPYKNVCQNGG